MEVMIEMKDNDSNEKHYHKDSEEESHSTEPIKANEKNDTERADEYKITTGNEDLDELLDNIPDQEKKMIMKT